MKSASLDSLGPQYVNLWLQMAIRGIVFVTNLVPTANLDEIPLQYCMVLRCASCWLLQNITETVVRNLNVVSTCNTNESETINKMTKTQK